MQPILGYGDREQNAEREETMWALMRLFYLRGAIYSTSTVQFHYGGMRLACVIGEHVKKKHIVLKFVCKQARVQRDALHVRALSIGVSVPRAARAHQLHWSQRAPVPTRPAACRWLAQERSYRSSRPLSCSARRSMGSLSPECNATLAHVFECRSGLLCAESLSKS